MGFWDFFKRKNDNPKNAENEDSSGLSIKASMVADQLDQLGYFKYADPSDIEQLKLEIAKGLVESQYMAQVTGSGPQYKTIDPRHYTLDGEDLFEQGGIVDSLKEMNPFFEKLNIKLTISDHVEEYDTENQWLDHEITINGKKYVIFKKFEGYGWGEAAQRFADLVNDQLRLQESDERLYLIYGGNDGRAIFLTDELHDLVSRYIKDPRERPLKTDDWCRVQSVQYAAIV